MPDISLDDLWDSAPSAQSVFQKERLAHLPPAASLYLEHAIKPGTPLASAVRLRMHGEIKLNRWHPFTAEQVICQDRGMIWCATVRMNVLPLRGSDRFLDGEGSMNWKLFGLVPIMNASGPDVTRSAIGRFQIESIWLPSVLCGPDVMWKGSDLLHPHAHFAVSGEIANLKFTQDDTGRLHAASLLRWGQQHNEPFHYRQFGGCFDEEATFGGYTIPTRVRVGWNFGEDGCDGGDEFFRATIEDAQYR